MIFPNIRRRVKVIRSSFLYFPVSGLILLEEDTGMPILSLFYGLLDGEILEGAIPKSKMKLVEAWMVIHHDDLEANWKLLSQGDEFFKIDPLK